MRRPDLTPEELLEAYEGGRRDFHGLHLDGLSVPGADLRKAWFENSSLVAADFSGTKLEGADFVNADLTEARLRGASMGSVNLSSATLTRADLHKAWLPRTFFTFTSCIGADISNGHLGEASMFRANLDEADLTNANLELVNLQEATLTDARVDGAILHDTLFLELDVSSFCEAASLVHQGPSWVDARTIMKSYKHPRLKPFMIDCGVPEIFAEYMIDCARALGDDVLHELMQSTFISYGGPDEDFARRLYDALRANGVVTFFFPETARVGERIGDEVFNALQRHDRMILVCSRASLDRPGVLNEIQETLDREARDGGATYLIPVMLDDYLLTEWAGRQPVLAERVKRRVAADFRDLDRFDGSLDRLLAALKKTGPRQ